MTTAENSLSRSERLVYLETRIKRGHELLLSLEVDLDAPGGPKAKTITEPNYERWLATFIDLVTEYVAITDPNNPLEGYDDDDPVV